ncbi:odorant receptor 67a-like [Cryptotermes secundus]|uniref:odorant receptor 67a-like n=1 Tax=Cryptotermes secundus TaxID=105785 RepID=UPI000CD7BE31|nr:odorant receptor 67a-like [Cryptotermes secundus]
MNKCFSTLFFVLFLTASLLVCLLGFEVIVVPPPGLLFARVLLHLSATVLELCFFCWYGSELMQKSEDVYQAAYGCQWQDLSNGTKQLICMIIMKAQSPVALRAGFFGDLCLPTFSSLMTNAYSYMALLRKLYEEDDA